MTHRAQTLLEALGMALVAVGLGIAWLPLGVIAAGAALIAIGNAPLRAPRQDDDDQEA